MGENRKLKAAPTQNGAYGQGVSAGTRATLTKRNAKNPGQGNKVTPQYELNQPRNKSAKRYSR